jgi:hypothetical protein
MALGCDMVNVGREAMLSIGCIQAQRCHAGTCPTGVATQNALLMRGLDPTVKSARAANYVRQLRKELLLMSRSAGVPHPGLVGPDDLEIVGEAFDSRTVREVFHYEAGWHGIPDERRRETESLIGAGGEHPTPTGDASTEDAQ